MDARNAPPSSPGTVEELARELKRLLKHGGARRPKVATLAKRVGISQSTLYAYLAGTTLPSSEALDDLLRELDAEPADVRRLATARDALARRRRVVDVPPETPWGATPQELPLAPGGFRGRGAELARLDAALGGPDRTTPATPVVAIAGTAGVGKTALALHWCHRVADRFPDGALYVDLLGWSGGAPRTTADVLAGLLRSLGAADVPEDVDERARQYRSRLAGRRMLVVLDNALEAEQVRPLLPGAATCLVVVTSRTELTGLQVDPGALPLVLQPLPERESLALLGDNGTDTPTAAAQAVVARCAGLPLALRIVAARAASHPEDGLERVAADLLERDGLDAFEIGDAATSVRAVFSWSERHLDPRACRLFWLLGLLPSRDADLATLAALAGTGDRAAREHVDALVRAHLLEPLAGGRYGLHDLLREHAHERALAELARAERSAALVRVVNRLRSTCSRAMEHLHTSWEGDSPEPADEGHLDFDGPDDAQAWLRREWVNLVAVVELTAAEGWVEQTRSLAELLRRHLDQGGRHRDAARILGHLLEACRAAGDVAGEATALRDLGVAAMRLGEHETARTHFDRALLAARNSGDPGCEGGALNNLGNLHERLSDYDGARACYEEALPLAVAAGIRGGEATLHNNIAVTHKGLANPAAAIEHCRRALAIFEELGDIGGRARSLGNLGESCALAGDHDEAVVHLTEALCLARQIDAGGIEIEVLNALGETRTAAGDPCAAMAEHEAALAGARAIGDRYEEARSLVGIGVAHAGADRPEAAVCSLREAEAIYAGLGLPEADRVRERLVAVEGTRSLTA